MICPSCGDEYREGFTECAECHVALVAKPLEEHGETHHPDLVTIYTAGNTALVPVIESVLRGAGIEFLVKSDRVQDLFGWGRIGLGYNAITGPVQIQVTTDDREAAEELLKTIENVEPSGA
jgi:Putative prokaryotic signal transducing protein